VPRVRWAFAPHATPTTTTGAARRDRDDEPQLPL